ncbi:EF-hand domain-containing protein [Rhizobium leguminosarum]|jgi:Ca2+-binding EF-hand superfamily protein|uniref:EF-hand domain-containing protein n=1 Tax=Rhizobium leguminosarum TaxID=384 RepID=UPI0024B3B2B1|nr:EF-hand domain-containing protein [Rhizobium leguminosarum]WHO83558.1 EF-hand domain-containing protein [Rhizobium leguminosarum]
MASTTITNPLTRMLDGAFTKFDQNKDGKLDTAEFKTFNELLKPGIAVDETGKPKVDYSSRMDLDGDHEITREEMHATTVLMPAALTDPSLNMMLNYLNGLQDDPNVAAAAARLAADDDAAS